MSVKPPEVVDVWTVRHNEMSICSSHQTVFLPVRPHRPIQHTLNSARSVFENVSAALPKYSYNIRTPHVSVFDWIWAELSLRLLTE